MFQTKRFGLVASKQEYMMLCRADRHMKQKKKLTGQHLPAFKVHKRVCNVMEINMIDVQLMQAFHDHDIETIKRLQSTKLNLDND